MFAAGVLALVVAIGVVGYTALQPAEKSAANPLATPLATPLPAWATTLADRYRQACGTGPTAGELAALGQTAAQEKVDEAVANCTSENGGGGGGGGKGHRKGKG